MVEENTHTKVSAMEYYRVRNDELYFQGKADLKYLINAWQKLDVEDHPMAAAVRDMILSEWEKRPELHGRHESTEIFHKHADFIKMACSIKYSLDMQTNPNGMFALLTPMTMETVWCSPAMSELKMDVTSMTSKMIDIRNAAGLLILIFRLYYNKLDVSKLPIPKGDGFSDVLSYQPDPNGPIRYYRMRVDNEIYSSTSWSVGMECEGELPELTQADIDEILSNPFSPDHIRSIVDTSRFMFNGVMFLWAEEITHNHEMSIFRDQLSKRDVLRRRQHLYRLQDQVRDIMRIPDIEMGILLSPFDADSRRARWQPYLKSLRFTKEVEPGNLQRSDVYVKALSNQQIINSIKDEVGLSLIKEAGFRSLLIAPLLHHGECIGLIEFGSQKDHAFDFYSATRLVTLSEYVAMAINHVHEGEHERIMAVIKQTCTAIHPSVEWRFQEMARNYLQQIEHDEIPTPEPVIFKSVVPLFGVSDIRGSSTKRNDSIQADLEHQLGLAAEVIATAGATHPRPVFNELGFRIQQHQAAIAKGLRSGDETRIYMFLRQVVESAFDELGYLSDEIRDKIDQYRKELDPEVGVVYQVRKSYDQSVMQINDTIGAYIDMQQELAQKMIPHYFEKFKTDGVDHNIYVGDSLLESGTCSPLDLRNLYLWQLMTMCGVVWLMRDIKPQLNTPLDTAHLILVQSTPLNITFQPEEKHFSVDGAYNARYEIVKKRIDKACIQRTGERLTQPGQIAIVYTQEREYQMYREFITYLQNLGFLTENVIDELLEDLQGVHGLRALRVKVTEQPPKGWDPKKPQTSLGIEWGPNSK